MKKYRVVSLFSGAMGLDLGLEKTGRFEVVACVEVEPSYCATIRENQRAGLLSSTLRVYQADISTLDPLKVLADCGIAVGDIDLVVGGPPCQSFSTAGRRRTVQDPRGTLLWEFLRFVKAMQPRFFVMENVRGLLSAALQHRPIATRPDKGGAPLALNEEPGSVVRLFSEDLQSASFGGYHMDCFEVNAVNYGAPQLRERAIFLGNRFNAIVNFPDPTHGPGLNRWATLRDAIGILNEPIGTLMDFSPRKKSFLALIPEGSNWRSLPISLQKLSMGKAWDAKGGRSGWWRRLSYDLPSPTLMTMPNHSSTALCHPSEVRALSLKEYAAIQEFPADWVFCGTSSQQYAQVGNAVPVRLGAVAGKVVAESLDELATREWRPYLIKPHAFRVVYIKAHIRTRQWFKNGKIAVWEDGGSNDRVRYQDAVTHRRERELAHV